ncbi:MAG TPA: PilC/PilY family type IV pilus protein [Casimicrobiaceae bacterium]|jgi:type IV pilus assembly protein PilY1
MKTQRPYFALRALSGVLAFLIGFGPITPLAFAATPLADGPINVNIQARPNIVFTLDDSTSMQLDFLPDYVVMDTLTNVATTYCRAATGLTACGSVGSAAIPQYVYAEWGMPTGAGNPWPAGYGGSSYGPPAAMTSAFNSMFYNPVVTYVAPLKYDGSSYADMTDANTTAWTKVPADPYLFPTKFVNLQTKVNVGVWCNTTYAGPFTKPAGVAADRDGITIGGDFCRINGFPYVAGGNGAPKTDGDYSYPYSDNVTAGAPLSAPYFATTTRTIHCDPNLVNGTNGAATAEKAPTAPTCDPCGLSCPVALVLDPANPVGCDPGCLNPAECTICGTKCPVATTYSCGTTCTTPALNCLAAGGSNWPKIGPTTCTAGPNQKCTTHPGTCPAPGAWKADAASCSTVINGKSKTAGAVPAALIGKSYEWDANTDGVVCRRNNFTYTDVTAGGWTYPSGNFTLAVAGGTCGSIAASINRHYYKAAVQWCDTQIGTPPFTGGAKTNDKWRGFGKGTCQAEKTTVYKYPKYVKYGADLAVAQDNYTDAAFYLVELDYKNKKIIERNGTPATTISHTYDDGAGGTVTITRDGSAATPAANELVNYANWFAYYRTRILAGKTVTSLAFSELTDKFRVGFHTLSNLPASTFLTINDFKGGAGNQREAWFNKLTGVSIPMGNDTPLLEGVVRIGEWFKSTTGTSGALSGSTDPIKLSCQKNYHMMFTDGYTNQNAKPVTVVGNLDGVKIPATCGGAQAFPPDCMPETIVSLPAATDWPWRYREGVTAVDDSLADYTLAYWMTDLRPSSFAKTLSDNNVPTSVRDPAKWQHLNFAALSLGTQGNLPSLNTSKTEASIDTGATRWPWLPTTAIVNRPGITGVDDLWHAAINGRSLFVNAHDPSELQQGMQSILREIQNQQAARAGAAFSSVAFGASNNFIYRVTIEPGWGGTLTKVEVDPLGEAGELTVITNYHDVLAAQVTPASVGDTPWYDKRNVVTWDPSAKKAVAFKHANLTGTQQSSLGGTTAVQQKIVDYLRGDRSNEGTALKNFRVRAQILGDIDNSSPVVVGEAKGQYSDSTDPGYEAFKATTTSRKKMVYVGANDGMLHAFAESTGTEVFAFIPSFMYSTVADKGLAMLAKKEPFFKHQMFVDSTPVAADVKIGSNWKTYLFGGLGKGGKGFYAIDITDPGAIATEADAAAAVKWEFTDSEMGYSYGKPLVAKTYADGWVVIFTSGYDATGKAKLYVVDIATGNLIRKLETTASGDAGLAQVSGFVLSFKNQYLEQIYGGDLNGDVWRFDVSKADSTKWTVDKFAELRIASASQSVTTAPQIEVDLANGVDRYVMIGTGRLLHEDDLVTYKDQQQTMYAMRDGTVLKPLASGSLPLQPRGDVDFTVVDPTSVAGFTGLSVKGWYMDLPVGERIITPIASELGLLGWAGSKPPDNECLPGLKASIYVRKFTNAESVVEDDTGTVVASLNVDEGAVGMEFINVYSTTPNDPTLKIAITLGTDGRTMYIDLAKGIFSGDHRMSWRLMGQ